MKRRNDPLQNVQFVVDPLRGGPHPEIDIPLGNGPPARGRAGGIDVDITGVGERTSRTPSPPKRQAGRQKAASRKKTAPARAPAPGAGGQAYGDDGEGPRPRPVSRKTLRRRRRRKKFILAGLLAFLLIVGFALSVTVLFPIKAFEVSGECQYSQDEIVAAFGHTAGENIFQFRISTAEDELARRLPYLETVKVRRRLPGTVVFLVTPALETYFMPVGEGGLVLSAGLKVLRQTQAAPEGLCTVTGLEVASYEVGRALALSDPAQKELFATLGAALEAAAITEVTALDVADSLELSFTWRGRVTVALGTSAQLDYKLRLVARVLSEGIADGETARLDASVPGKVTKGAA